ncbi:hypothetical protein [Candidatus Palauibacter sp.]|uniref:hypothetical protein n=1 Tax=Candidatus Palauibacter sp. TaxID=3101350 RepID=UPI003B5ACF95
MTRLVFLGCCWVSGFLLVDGGVFHATAHAQSPGERVRVTVSDDRLTGELLGMDGAGISIDVDDGESRRLSVDEIELIERSVGTRSYAGEGLAIGFGAGVAIGLAATSTSDACDRTEPYMPMAFGCSGATAIGAVVLGALGGVVGLVAGAGVRGERWEPIPVATPLEPSLRFVVDAGPDGRGLPPGVYIGGRLRF